MGVLVQTNNMMTPTSTPPATPRAPVWHPKAPTKNLFADRLKLGDDNNGVNLVPCDDFEDTIEQLKPFTEEEQDARKKLADLLLKFERKCGPKFTMHVNVPITDILDLACGAGRQVCPQIVADELRAIDPKLDDFANEVCQVLKTKTILAVGLESQPGNGKRMKR